MKKLSIARLVIPAAGLLGIASVAVHPSGAMKSHVSGAPLLKETITDPAVLSIMQRSCQSCHSEQTEWPWYSYIAPMSWLIENDVRQGRNHMNLSRWQEYNGDKRQQLLSEVGVVVRSRKMPLPKYTLLHPGAKLTDAEVDRIYKWSRSERRRLRSVADGKSPASGG